MNIYVGNLNYRVKEADLQQVMEDYGTVSSVKVIMDRETGRSKGFAFIEMEDDAAASKAIAELNGEIKENKEDYLNLLLIADPSVDMIQHYLGRGHLYIMQLEEIPVCVTVVVSDKETAEIKNLATHPDYLRRGYASRMMSFIVEHYRETPNIIVGTGSTGIPGKEFYQLDFYRKCGFVESHIIKNFFVDNYPEPIFEDNGEQCIDMIYLRYAR